MLRRILAWIRHRPRAKRTDALAVRDLRAESGTWIAGLLRESVPRLPEGDWSSRIEGRAAETQRLGEQPLWSGYDSVPDIGGRSYRGVKRSSDEVRTSSEMGRFFAWLITDRRPAVIVEFGTAFGVSGMYFVSGLERNGVGRLLTFEPNEVWAGIAERNLAAISRRYELTVGTFEENVGRVLAPGERIDVAFIDAIHTSAFVEPQFEAVAARVAVGGLVLLDDIDFSADMRSCWEKIREDRRLAASVEVGRVGIVEFRR